MAKAAKKKPAKKKAPAKKKVATKKKVAAKKPAAKKTAAKKSTAAAKRAAAAAKKKAAAPEKTEAAPVTGLLFQAMWPFGRHAATRIGVRRTTRWRTCCPTPFGASRDSSAPGRSRSRAERRSSREWIVRLAASRTWIRGSGASPAGPRLRCCPRCPWCSRRDRRPRLPGLRDPERTDSGADRCSQGHGRDHF